MPYIGHAPTNSGNFYILDDFNGLGQDGSSSTYDQNANGTIVNYKLMVAGVAITPNVDNLIVTIDGVLQHPTDAYTISGSILTFTGAPASGVDFHVVIMGQSSTVGEGSIGADELQVSGDGTNNQLLKSDGDGTMSWINQNTVTASTAATLATARTIGGVSFDGSANIAVTLAATSTALATARTIGGTSFDGTANIAVALAATATTLATTRAINGVNFDGSAAITVTADANTLSGTTLKSTVVSSSLTSVGALTGLGIGTTSPDTLLEVGNNAANTDNGIRISANGTGNPYLQFANSDSATNSVPKAMIIQDTTNSWYRGDLLFCLDNTGDTSVVTTADEVMRLTATGNATFGGTGTFTGIINANGGFSRRLDQNTGTSMEMRNNHTGTGHYAEMYIGDSVSQLTMGYSNNYASSEWAGGWVYTNVGNLHLKSTNGSVQLFSGGNSNADRTLILDSSQNATFAGKVGIDSGGYTQKQLHIGDEGHILLSHNSDTDGEYAGIFMRAESDEENGMLRTKGLIAFERTGAYGVGDMKFCVDGTGNNTAVTNSNVVLKLDSSSNATFSGNVVIGTAGKGIDFSAQTATSASGATTTSEVLDHYEEGTWTPTLPSGGSITVHSASYTKTGRNVYYTFYANVTPTNNSTEFQIGGLPFVVASGNNYPAGSIGYTTAINTSSWHGQLAYTGNSVLYMHQNSGTADTVPNSWAGGASTGLIMTGEYIT